MYTSTIGRIFLKRYNEEKQTSYTPEGFFDTIFYPLFFDHNKYMMTAGNSPFENPKISWKEMILKKKEYESEEQRESRFVKFKDKVDKLYVDASTAVGYPTLDITTGTSGQITTINSDHTKDDIYLSWIGAALGLGIKGGLNILFNDPLLLLDICSGWVHYREHLEKNELLKGNQINTWNSHWLSHLYDSRVFQKDYPTYGIQESIANSDGILEFPSLDWVSLLTKIVQRKELNSLVGYIYDIGKSNRTIGFIPFSLEQIKRPYELYMKLFGEDQYWQNEKRIIQLFGGGIGFTKACQKGEIGIEALMPEGLSEYMRGKNLSKKNSGDDNDRIITYNTYKTWVVAMLNNEELWQKTMEFAVFLNSYASEGDRKKTDRSNDVDNLLNTQGKKAFIEKLTTVISKTKSNELCNEMAYAVHKMSNDDVKYLITLIKLHYETIKQS